MQPASEARSIDAIFFTTAPPNLEEAACKFRECNADDVLVIGWSFHSASARWYALEQSF